MPQGVTRGWRTSTKVWSQARWRKRLILANGPSMTCMSQGPNPLASKKKVKKPSLPARTGKTSAAASGEDAGEGVKKKRRRRKAPQEQTD